MRKYNGKGNWIWTDNNQKKNDWVMFRKTIFIKEIPSKVVFNIAVDSKYWLYINGKAVVYEGGLNRGPFYNAGYIDVVEVSNYLNEGENTIACLVWYWGNEGRNNIDSTQAGFLLYAEGIQLISDETWKASRIDSYIDTMAPYPSYLFGGYNIGFDANRGNQNFFEKKFDDTNWKKAILLGKYPQEPWNDLYVRPIPLYTFTELKSFEKIDINQLRYTCSLPHAMHASIAFEVFASKGTIIYIKTDRYIVHGGPGEEEKKYRGHRVEYHCKDGVNRFETLWPLYGESLIIDVSNPLEITHLRYREVGYNTELKGDFSTGITAVNRFVEKAKRTLYVCMRDNFMDCPDREKGQWIGDVSIQVPQVFFLADEASHALIKKSIMDFINLRHGDVLLGNIPGKDAIELPAQSLHALGQQGFIATYYDYTNDIGILKQVFKPIINYVKLWGIQDNGCLVHRKGDWDWYDHLDNVDNILLEHLRYYDTLCFTLKIATIIDDHSEDVFLLERKEKMFKAFSMFSTTNGYTSSDFVDARANALAIVLGVVPKSNYSIVKNVLLNNFDASPYMEATILEALWMLDLGKEALDRTLHRYRAMIDSDDSTLWENFDTFGTKNHAWSGYPLVLFYRYIAGISISENGSFVTFKPNTQVLKTYHIKIPVQNGLLLASVEKNNHLLTVKIIVPNVTIDLVLDNQLLGVEKLTDVVTKETFDVVKERLSSGEYEFFYKY